MRKSNFYSLLASASLLASGAAWAQDKPAAPPAAPKASNTGVEDIIVTAQRREEHLVNVPLSIQAMSGKSLVSNGIQGLADLNFTSPGLIVRSGTGYTDVFIRGIGNSVDVGAEPSVTTNVDDVPHIYGSLISDFVNVERIEVLKGAQGGLYGRNATGGVINIITKQPGNKLEFNGRASFGEYGTLNTAVYVNVPLTSTLAWNFSATRNYHHAYLKNIAPKAPYASGVYPGDAAAYDSTTGAACAPANGTTCLTNFGLGFLNGKQNPKAMNNGNVWGVDTKLRWQPSDNFKVTIAADYTQKHDAGGNGWVGSDYGQAAAAPFDFSGGEAGTYKAYMIGFLGAAGYLANYNQVLHIADTYFHQPGKHKVWGAYPAWGNTYDYGGSIKAVYSLPSVDITSISALRWNRSGFQGDIGAAAVPLAGFVVHVYRDYFYQELRAQTTDAGPLHLLGGATYFHDTINFRINGQFLGFTLSPTQSLMHTTSWSVYGQAGYDITDRLNLTASLRYIHEQRRANFINGESNSGREHKLIPAATLSYKTDGGTIYARYAQGYKTGGVNEVQFPSRYLQGCTPQQISSGECVSNTTFKGESVNTYEIGYRTNLFDNRVQFTSAIFYNDYKNLQIAVGGNAANSDVSLTYLNAGKARTYGAEASVTWRVIPPLTLSGNIGYLNAKYQNFSFAGNHVVDPFNYSGNRMALSPRWQGGFNAVLDQPLNGEIHLIGNLLYAYTGATLYSPCGCAAARRKGYSLVNLRLGARTDDSRYGVYLDVTNLFDQYYAAYGSTFANADGTLRGAFVPGTPRVIKGTVELKF
jgi:iron complex outermembrane receptor protein